MEEQTISPTFKKEVEINTLSFPEAIKEVILNKEITRMDWKNRSIYGVLRFDEDYQTKILVLHKDDDKFYQWIVSDGDLLADDWIVL